MSWNIQKPGDYINGPLTVATSGVTHSISADSSYGWIRSIGTNLGLLIGTQDAKPVHLIVQNSIRATVDVSGNFGLAVTPSPWSSFRAIGINNQGFHTYANILSSTGGITSNGYYNGTNWIYGNSASSGRYEMQGNVHVWYVAPSGSAGTAIGFAQAMTMTGNGDLYVGATGPAYSEKMRIYGNYLVLDDGAYSGLIGKASAMGGSSASDFCIRSQQNLLFMAGGATERGRFNTTGAFVLAGGATAANGIGVTFPSAQSASTDANTLDDYEEGTWTGTLRGLTSDPTVAVTATGRYTKIGRQVTAQISFEGVSNAGASGDCFVAGLPFANGNLRTPGSAASYAGMTHTGTLISLVDGSSTNITFIDSRSNAAWVGAAHYPGTGRTICAEVTYTV